MTHNNVRFFTLEQAKQLALETHGRCFEAAKHTRRTLVFSHTTLLALRGMTLSLDTTLDPSNLHTSVEAQSGKSRLKGVEVHVWKNSMSESMIDDVIAGVSVEQAICQIAPYTDQDSLTMAMDWLTCHNPQLRQTTHTSLSNYITGLNRFTGSKVCKAALERSVEGTDSPQESLLRLHLVDAGLPIPAVNYEVNDAHAGVIHRVDMAYPQQKIAIEYDGEYHYDMSRWSYDLHKRNRLQSLGWKVFVATKENLRNAMAVEQFVSMVGREIHAGTGGISTYGGYS